MTSGSQPGGPVALTFNKRAFVYAVRLFSLLFVLGISISWVPEKTDALAERVVEIGLHERRITTLDSQLRGLVADRDARSRAAILAELAEFERKRALRIIDAPSVGKVAESHGKFIAADLKNMRLHLYEDGQPKLTLPIVSKGKNGSRWQTPSGLYDVQTKETDHFSSIGEVHMPYSMQFFGNFFIHGWPYYPGGEPVAEGFSGGCIRMTTEDAEQVFAFVDRGTPVFVYDEGDAVRAAVALTDKKPPSGMTARAYLLADIHTGRVYFEKGADAKRSIASISKFMTALVANETIHFGKSLSIGKNDGQTQGDFGKLFPGAEMSVGDAFYPLLMESNNSVAHALARHYGTENFTRWMNDKARAIGAPSLSFADASGISEKNRGTAEDIFKLARYLYNNQSFILNISKAKEHTISLADGSTHTFKNFNHFAKDARFEGGKTGFTQAAGETMVALFDVPVASGAGTTTVAAIILGSTDREGDIDRLIERFEKVAVLESGDSLAEKTIFSASAAAALAAPRFEELRVIEE